jgi:hypothetical protein
MLALAHMRASSDVVALAATGGTSPLLGFWLEEELVNDISSSGQGQNLHDNFCERGQRRRLVGTA